MKISNVNSASLNFRAKKPEIREADDIQRRARNEFPLLSTTYIDMFYISANKSNMDAFKQHKVDKVATMINEKIADLRDNSDREYMASSDRIPYVRVINYTKKNKVGNCAECSATVISALAANGIYDAQMSNIGLCVEFINKKTGRSEFKAIEPIDHSMVVTALNKKNPKEKDFIVIDSWLGFADSISGAKARYKKIFNEKFMAPEIKCQRSLFRINQYEKTKKFINYDDYDTRTKIVIYKAPDRYDKNDLCNLGIYTRIHYPNLNIHGKRDGNTLSELINYMCKTEKEIKK